MHYILDLDISINSNQWNLTQAPVREQIRGLIERSLPEYRIWNICYENGSSVDIMRDVETLSEAASEYLKVIKTFRKIFGKCSLLGLRILPKTKDQMSKHLIF